MNKYKKLLTELLLFLPALAAIVWLNTMPAVQAAGYVPIPQGLCDESSGFPCPQGATGVEMARSLTEKIIFNVRLLVGVAAVIVIILSGVKLVTAGGKEEVFSKESTTLIFAIIGLAFVALGGELAQIFNVDRGGFLKDPNVAVTKARFFSQRVEIIIVFIKYIIGSIAVIYVIRSGLRLVLMGGTDEEINKDKKTILYGILGLVFILMSGTVIKQVFFKIDTSAYPGAAPVQPKVDFRQLAREIAGATNIIAMIAGPFALLSLVAGGLMYTLAGGEEEKTKKAKTIIMWSLVGLVIIYAAFALVSTFVARQFESI